MLIFDINFDENLLDVKQFSIERLLREFSNKLVKKIKIRTLTDFL